jgi:hypothetical protein
MLMVEEFFAAKAGADKRTRIAAYPAKRFIMSPRLPRINLPIGKEALGRLHNDCPAFEA